MMHTIVLVGHKRENGKQTSVWESVYVQFSAIVCYIDFQSLYPSSAPDMYFLSQSFFLHYSINDNAGYVEVSATEVGYSHVSCTGDEDNLEECTITDDVTTDFCSHVGIVHQCLNGILSIA